MEVRYPPQAEDHWLRELTDRWEVRLRMRACRPVGPESGRLLQVLEIATRPEESGAIQRYLRGAAGISDLYIAAVAPNRLFVRAVGPMPPACGRLFDVGGYCLSCRLVHPGPGERRDWAIAVPGAAAVRTLSRAEGAGRPAGIRPFVPSKGLTGRQLDALTVAHRLGYYGYPRRAGLAEVARSLGIGRSAVAELLRRAERKVVTEEIERSATEPSPPSA